MFPLYVFLKPDAATGLLADRLRRALGLCRNYPPERFHVTVLRLGDRTQWTAAAIADLAAIVDALQLEPLSVRLDRLAGGALRPSRSASLRRVRRGLEGAVGRAGLPLIPHTSPPHLTLDYSRPRIASHPVAPICWRADRLHLICSHHGERRHEVLAQYPLIERQGSLFG